MRKLLYSRLKGRNKFETTECQEFVNPNYYDVNFDVFFTILKKLMFKKNKTCPRERNDSFSQNMER